MSGTASVKQGGLGAEIARLVGEAHAPFGGERPPEALQFGRLRIFCSQNVDKILEHGATLTIIQPMHFGRGDPFGLARPEFEERIGRLRAFTDEGHKAGITVLAYVTQFPTTPRTSKLGDPSAWMISEAWADAEWWNRYADFFGPRPEQPPEEWLQRRKDGTYGDFAWVPPGAPDTSSKELCGCPHSPGFRQYMVGVMNVLVAAGIDGIYLDHSELLFLHADDSLRSFQEFLSSRYTAQELRERFGIGDASDAMPAEEESDPLWAETVLFKSGSELEFHRHLRDETRKKDPDFIMAGNLWGGWAFKWTTIVQGSDIQLAALVDTFLYSEIATGTEAPEEGQRNVSGTRGGDRISMAPLVRILSASSRNGAATSYIYYPQTPNPIPTEDALFNIHRLAMAEAAANHTAFRRIGEEHAEPVHRATKSVHELLKSIEPAILDADVFANVAVTASLQTCYHHKYSYHLEVSRALADAGIAHEMVAPRSLTADALSHFQAVILPNVAVLTEAAYGEVVAYGRSGGTVIAFGEVAVLDPQGNPGPATTAGERLDCVELPIDPDKLAEDNENVATEKDLVRYEAWALGNWPASLRPTMQAVVSAVENAVGDNLTARLHGPEGVEITTMQRLDSDDLIVHALNYAVDLNGAVTPAEEVRISICVPKGKTVAGVAWHALDGLADTLSLTRTDGRAEFTVPKLDIYGIALVEVKS